MEELKVLLLGHGENSELHCLPRSAKDIDITNCITVDKDPRINPTFVADLECDTLPISNSSIDVVIDTGGGAGHFWYRKSHFWDEVIRIMKPNGTFHGRSKILHDLVKLGFRIHKPLIEEYKDEYSFILRKSDQDVVETWTCQNNIKKFTKSFEPEITTECELHIPALLMSQEFSIEDSWFRQLSYTIKITEGAQLAKSPHFYWTIEVTPKIAKDVTGLCYLSIQDIHINGKPFTIDGLKWQLDNFIETKKDNIKIHVIRSMSTPVRSLAEMIL
jgi:hypothetical protein